MEFDAQTTAVATAGTWIGRSVEAPGAEPDRGDARMRGHADALAALESRWRVHRDRLRGHEALLSWARLLAFGLLLSTWYPLRDSDALAALAAAASLGLFCILVRLHGRLREARAQHDRRLLMIGESRARLGGKATCVRAAAPPVSPRSSEPLPRLLDDGPRWILTEQEKDDLDLYAQSGGLFGLLNRTSTACGAWRLSDQLDHPMLEVRALRRRQDAVHWLEEQVEARLSIMAGVAALRGNDEAFNQLRRAIAGAAPLTWGIGGLVLLRGWSLATLGATVFLTYRVGMGDYGSGAWLLTLLVLNTAVFRSLAAELTSALRPWKNVRDVLSGWLSANDSASRQLGSLSGEPADLGILRAPFNHLLTRSVLSRLRSAAAWTDVGGPMHALFNHFFFYDLHVACGVLRRALPEREELLAGMSAVAELEALCSLACFGWEQPVRCRPTWESHPALCIEQGRHPAVEPARCVANSLRLGEGPRTWLITGSNMSGKSTFLRMAGVNALLAQMGASACAESMRLSPVRLMTDLRVRDNLADHESYFLAEVRHLKRMVQPPAGEAPLLGLIDEPFRGTNSDEQGAATLAVVQHLRQSGHLFVIATHERKVTELEDPRTVANLHFQENLSAQGMVFDYRLRPGPATTRNALRLLASEAYPESVLRDADLWVRRLSQPGIGIASPEALP